MTAQCPLCLEEAERLIQESRKLERTDRMEDKQYFCGHHGRYFGEKEIESE